MSGNGGHLPSGYFINVSDSGHPPPTFPTFAEGGQWEWISGFNLPSTSNFPVGVEYIHDGVWSVIPVSPTPTANGPIVLNMPNGSSNQSHAITTGEISVTNSGGSEASASFVAENVYTGNNRLTMASSSPRYNNFGNGFEQGTSSATGSSPLMFQSSDVSSRLLHSDNNEQCETFSTYYFSRRERHVCAYCGHPIQQYTAGEKCAVCKQPLDQQNPVNMGHPALEYTRNQ